MKPTLIKTPLSKFFAAIILIKVILIIAVVFLVKSCDNKIKEHKKETGKGLFEVLGEGVREIQQDFEKGYSDTLPDSTHLN